MTGVLALLDHRKTLVEHHLPFLDQGIFSEAPSPVIRALRSLSSLDNWSLLSDEPTGEMLPDVRFLGTLITPVEVPGVGIASSSGCECINMDGA